MGPSGSGSKSTLLNLMAGIDKVDSGTITIAGSTSRPSPKRSLPPGRVTNVGFIFQFYNLNPGPHRFRKCRSPLLLTGLSRSERRRHVELALRVVNLSARVAKTQLNQVGIHNHASLDYPANPNGSINSIAGICNESGRLFGLMPHPEAYLYRVNHPRWTREKLPDEGQGLLIFRNAVNFIRGKEF